MSRTFKVTKSATVDLAPSVEGSEKKIAVLVYSYWTNRKRVPGGMSKEAKEALKDTPRQSEYRVDGVIGTIAQLEKFVKSISGEQDAAKPWTWPVEGCDREYIYANSMSTQAQAVRWWNSRLTKIGPDYGTLLESDEVALVGLSPATPSASATTGTPSPSTRSRTSASNPPSPSGSPTPTPARSAGTRSVIEP